MGIEALGKEAFLNLLTTQLRFQDPLKPMESTEFVAQLAQFRELESAIEINKKLDTLAQGTAFMNNMGAASLLGRKVEVPGGRLTHQLGQSETILYQLEDNAEEVVIQVVNENGTSVKIFTLSDAQIKGANQVLWDGKDNQGSQVPAGLYSYVGAIRDGEGQLTPIKLLSEGEVTGVSYGQDGPFVTVNGTSVKVSEIVRIQK